MDIINTVIHSAIEFSNILSCVAVLSCTGAVFIFLIKATITVLAQREEIRAPTNNNYNQSMLQVPRLNMTRVHIPFTFRLLETGNNSYEEIKILVASQVKYSIQAYWGVSIRDLHMFLWKPWLEIKERAYSSNGILSDQYYKQIALDRREEGPHGDEQIVLKSPKPPMVLGAPPRLAYPLVLFLIRDADSNSIEPDETVLLVNVVHLRDPVCPLPTSILAQYLKQGSGQLSCLKQLYLATSESTTIDESISPSVQTSSLSLAEPVACAESLVPLLCSDGPQTEQVCIVCHYFPLSRALLPCRHTCICAICFSKLSRCPMCRAPISSYFCIRQEDYIPPGAFETCSSRTKNTVHWLDALNDRLTDFLGFR